MRVHSGSFGRARHGEKTGLKWRDINLMNRKPEEWTRKREGCKRLYQKEDAEGQRTTTQRRGRLRQRIQRHARRKLSQQLVEWKAKPEEREKVNREAKEEKCKNVVRRSLREEEREAVVYKRACCEFPSTESERVLDKGFGGGSGGFVG